MDENTTTMENVAAKRKRVVKIATLKGCTRLTVRSGRSLEAISNGFVTTSDRIKVDMNESNSEWMCILEPIHGFALAEYLTVVK